GSDKLRSSASSVACRVGEKESSSDQETSRVRRNWLFLRIPAVQTLRIYSKVVPSWGTHENKELCVRSGSVPWCACFATNQSQLWFTFCRTRSPGNGAAS